jgi:ATP-dependent Lhr-like helicase
VVDGELARAVLDALAPGGAWFFRQLADSIGSTDDGALSAVLWDLVWAGLVSNDTLAPIRALTGSGTPAHRTRRRPPRARLGGGARMPARTGPPETAGRWALLPAIDDDPTRRAHATAERLLDRHGVVTRGAVVNERVPGGFAGVYKVLSAFEDSGRARRGYFVEGLGAAQFGTAGAVDRLRTFTQVDDSAKPAAVALAATDPANPYGAALPWPPSTGAAEGGGTGHKPGRKAGAIVVLVDGELVLYVERGGRTLLTWSEEPDRLEPAAAALAEAVRRGALGRLTVERAVGDRLLGSGDTPLRHALQLAGFVATPKGLRISDARR